MEDIGLYLQDFVSSLDNLPSEVQHYFTELKAHEQEFQQIRRGIHQRERTLQNHLRNHGYAADQPHPQEEQLIAKCHRDFQKALSVADEKDNIAQRALELVQRHLKRLEGDLKRHELEEKQVGGGRGAMAGTPGSAVLAGGRTGNGGLGTQGFTRTHSHLSDNIWGGANTGTPGTPTAGEAAGYSVGGGDLTAGAVWNGHGTPTPKGTAAGLLTATLSSASSSSLSATVAGGTSTPIARQLKRKHGAVSAAADDGLPAGTTTPTPSALGRTNHDASLLATPAPALHLTTTATPTGRGRGASVAASSTKGQKRVKGRQSATAAAAAAAAANNSLSAPAEDQNVHIIENLEASANGESDEALYCICQQVSYGDMVACDGDNCPHEWFHYDCVGLTSPPKGAWYCADCLASRKMVK